MNPKDVKIDTFEKHGVGIIDLGPTYNRAREVYAESHRRAHALSKAHWDSFTIEQQRKIIENTPPWLIGDALRNAKFSLFDRATIAFKEGWKRFIDIWEATR